MPHEEELWMNKLIQARDKLLPMISHHQEVTLVDIGQDPEHKTAKPVLRIHVRAASQGRAIHFPDEIDGCPVRVLIGEYFLQ